MPPAVSANPVDHCTPAELKRFAICWLNSDQKTVNWDTAAAQYDTSVQVASFRTVTKRAADKVYKDSGAVNPASVDGARAKKSPATRKRKAGDDTVILPSPSKKAKAKKAKTEVMSEGDENGVVEASRTPSDTDELL